MFAIRLYLKDKTVRDYDCVISMLTTPDGRRFHIFLDGGDKYSFSWGDVGMIAVRPSRKDKS